MNNDPSEKTRLAAPSQTATLRQQRSIWSGLSRAAAFLLVTTTICLGENAREEIPEPFRSFFPEAQKHVEDFPMVPVGTAAGKHETFTVRLDKKPIAIGEHRFACVRFVAPEAPGRDMVWVFSAPADWAQWYILPATGEMKAFRNWVNGDRLYEEFPATLENPVRLQSLEAASFKPGATYILWFKQQAVAPGEATLTGAINFLEPAKKEARWDAEAIDKGLGLKTAPMDKQIAYVGSRGGRILLDGSLFDPDDAQGRIEDLLYTRRHYTTTSNGFFIKTNIIIPVCRSKPSLAKIQAKYGDPDVVLSAEERRLFNDQDTSKEDACYYDYFVFLAQGKAGQLQVRRVTSEPTDTSAVKPRVDGLTWGDLPVPGIKLRIFYRDKKEIARIAFWGESKARLLSGALPVDTFRKPGGEEAPNEELKYLGDGAWEESSKYGNGQIAKTASLKAHAYQGPMREYFPDGKPQAEANYEKGLLEGTLKQWRENGEHRELHFHAGEVVKDGADPAPK